MAKKAAKPPKKARKRAPRGKVSGRHDVTEPLYDADQVAQAFRDAMGSVADAARILGCTRQTLYVYCRDYPQVQAALDESRKAYKETCQELARDNHLTQLLNGHAAATSYELEKMEPKPDGAYLDLSKLTKEEAIILHQLLQKAKPDGTAEKAA